jgi:hypothetical protein
VRVEALVCSFSTSYAFLWPHRRPLGVFMVEEYEFGKTVKLGCRILAVLLCLLLMTLPIGIWIWIKAGKARLRFRQGGFSVNGLGFGEEQWDFSQLARIGLLRVPLPNRGLGGVIAKMMSGGEIAVNLCAIGKDGRQRRFMLSRYAGTDEILQRITASSGLPLETVAQGLMGPKWQQA